MQVKQHIARSLITGEIVMFYETVAEPKVEGTIDPVARDRVLATLRRVVWPGRRTR